VTGPRVLLAAVSALAVSPVVLAADGRVVFQRRCAACHSVQTDAPRGPGPNLRGVLGRVVGGDPGFAYSPVLEAARETGERWDADSLRRFLEDPEEMFPGLWMGNNGLRNEADREAVAAFLAEGSSFAGEVGTQGGGATPPAGSSSVTVSGQSARPAATPLRVGEQAAISGSGTSADR
jgi:cytochrome c